MNPATTTTVQDRAVSLPGSRLAASLRRARRVWWAIGFVRSVAIALGVAAAFVGFAWLQAWAAGRGGSLPGASADLWLAVGGAFAVVLLVALVVLAVRAPSLVSLARRADRVFDQAQRLSTTYEVLERGSASSLVASALVDDAERRVPGISWARVGRSPWPSWAPVSVGLALTLGVGAVAVPVPNRVVRPATVDATASAGPDLAARDADAVRRFAEVLEAVAVNEDSAYLRAVASSFADLADRMDAGEIDAAEASRALEELVGHLEAAAEDVSAEFAEAVRSALGPDASEDAAALDADGDDVTSDPAGAGETGGDPTASSPPTSNADASAYMALEDFANEVGRNPGGLGLRATRPAPQELDGEGAFYGGVMRAETDPDAAAPQASGLRADAPGGGDVVGAADRSSERAGDAAGGGSAALGAGSDAFLDLEAEAMATAALPANEREDGRFVGVDLVPEEALAGARSSSVAGSDAPFRRTDESARLARTIGATYREVVGRYFMPGAVRTGESP